MLQNHTGLWPPGCLPGCLPGMLFWEGSPYA